MVLALGSAQGLLSITPVSAQAALQLSIDAGPPTTLTTATGTGFFPAERISLGFGPILVGSTNADDSGVFSQEIQVPSAAPPGLRLIRARGETSGATAAASFLVRTDWSQFHFDAGRSGFNPYENVISPANVSRLKVSWVFGTGGPLNASPAVVGGVAYVGSEDRNLYAIDAKHGTMKWWGTTQGAVRASAAVGSGSVFVDSLDHSAYQWEALAGALEWTGNGGGANSPGYEDGIFYHVSSGGSLYARDADTHQHLWQQSVSCGGCSNMAPAVMDGSVFVSTAGRVTAYDAATGSKLWEFNDTGAVSPAVAADDRVFVGGSSLTALDPATGDVLWRYGGGGFDQGTPAVAVGVVYARSGAALHAVDAATGGGRWVSQLQSSDTGSPTVANGLVWLGEGSRLSAYEAASGRLIWFAYPTPSFAIRSSPTITDGTVYISVTNGRLYAYRLSL